MIALLKNRWYNAEDNLEDMHIQNMKFQNELLELCKESQYIIKPKEYGLLNQK